MQAFWRLAHSKVGTMAVDYDEILSKRIEAPPPPPPFPTLERDIRYDCPCCATSAGGTAGHTERGGPIQPYARMLTPKHRRAQAAIHFLRYLALTPVSKAACSGVVLDRCYGPLLRAHSDEYDEHIKDSRRELLGTKALGFLPDFIKWAVARHYFKAHLFNLELVDITLCVAPPMKQHLLKTHAYNCNPTPSRHTPSSNSLQSTTSITCTPELQSCLQLDLNSSGERTRTAAQ